MGSAARSGGLLGQCTFGFSLKSVLNKKGCVALVLVAEVLHWSGRPRGAECSLGAPAPPRSLFGHLECRHACAGARVAGLTLTLLTSGGWAWSEQQLPWGPSCRAWAAHPPRDELRARAPGGELSPCSGTHSGSGAAGGCACGWLAGEPGLMKTPTTSVPLTV